jgi:hypothetical protein
MNLKVENANERGEKVREYFVACAGVMLVYDREKS